MMDEKKTHLTVKVSITDTPVFKELLTYTETLLEILSEYNLSEENRRKLNAVSENLPNILREEFE